MKASDRMRKEIALAKVRIEATEADVERVERCDDDGLNKRQLIRLRRLLEAARIDQRSIRESFVAEESRRREERIWCFELRITRHSHPEMIAWIWGSTTILRYGDVFCDENDLFVNAHFKNENLAQAFRIFVDDSLSDLWLHSPEARDRQAMNLSSSNSVGPRTVQTTSLFRRESFGSSADSLRTI